MFRRIRKAFTKLFRRGRKENYNIGIDQPVQLHGKPDAPVQKPEKLPGVYSNLFEFEKPENKKEREKFEMKKPESEKQEKLLYENPEDEKEQGKEENPENEEQGKILNENPENEKEQGKEEKRGSEEQEKILNENPENEEEQGKEEKPESEEQEKILNENPENEEEQGKVEKPENEEQEKVENVETEKEKEQVRVEIEKPKNEEEEKEHIVKPENEEEQEQVEMITPEKEEQEKVENIEPEKQKQQVRAEIEKPENEEQEKEYIVKPENEEEQEEVEIIKSENEEREKEHIVKPENEEQKKVENVEPEKEKEQVRAEIVKPENEEEQEQVEIIKSENEEQEKGEIVKIENEKEQEKGKIEKPENKEEKAENEKEESEKAAIKESEKCKESAFSKTPIPKELAGQPSRRYIEDYDLRSLLGKGGFGTVYLAKHKATGEKVAVKALHKQGIKKERAAKSVILEKNILKLAKRNQNPFLVGLFASFRSEHHVCLVTDYCAGGDLSTYLKENPLPRERVVFYSGCVVLGLQFLHQHNIIHRDIKPENILLDSDGYAKITDYGVAKRTLSYGKTTWSKGGTCYYMAPEMIKEIGYTKSVDWWAFGIMIYRMLTAKYPFNGSDRAILKHNITENQPKFPDTMSEDSIDIIERLLNKNPEMRLGSTDEDAEDVKKCSFYKDIDFDALAKKQIEPPYIPKKKTTGCFRRIFCRRKKRIAMTEEGCEEPLNLFPEVFKNFECSLFLPSDI